MSCSLKNTAPAWLSFRAPHWLTTTLSGSTKTLLTTSQMHSPPPRRLRGHSLQYSSWLSQSCGLAWPLFWQVFFAVANANLACLLFAVAAAAAALLLRLRVLPGACHVSGGCGDLSGRGRRYQHLNFKVRGEIAAPRKMTIVNLSPFHGEISSKICGVVALLPLTVLCAVLGSSLPCLASGGAVRHPRGRDRPAGCV